MIKDKYLSITLCETSRRASRAVQADFWVGKSLTKRMMVGISVSCLVVTSSSNHSHKQETATQLALRTVGS